MRSLLIICSVLLCLCRDQVQAAEVASLASERNLLSITYANETATPLKFELRAGSFWRSEANDRFIALHSAEIEVPPATSAALLLPVAALSPGTEWHGGTKVTLAEGSEPRLAPLLKYLATRNDVPRRTSQLTVLAILEDLAAADWEISAINRRSAEEKLTPGEHELREVATMLDAISLLRMVYPQGSYKLLTDSAIKIRALHNVTLRPKALQLFGLTISGEPAEGGVAPDLGQLLHTKAGDNCPVCRLRQQMAPREDSP